MDLKQLTWRVLLKFLPGVPLLDHIPEYSLFLFWKIRKIRLHGPNVTSCFPYTFRINVVQKSFLKVLLVFLDSFILVRKVVPFWGGPDLPYILNNVTYATSSVVYFNGKKKELGFEWRGLHFILCWYDTITTKQWASYLLFLLSPKRNGNSFSP